MMLDHTEWEGCWRVGRDSREQWGAGSISGKHAEEKVSAVRDGAGGAHSPEVTGVCPALCTQGPLTPAGSGGSEATQSLPEALVEFPETRIHSCQQTLGETC